MIFSSQREPYIKRLPQAIYRPWGIQAYDLDNLYPQRADEVRKRSFTLNAAINKYAEFIHGDGFQDQNLAKLILNSEQQTANDVLEYIARDKSSFGFALHFKYNPFTFRIMEVTPIDFMYCRLGITDWEGNVCDIKYSRNWEQDPNKELYYQFRYDSYPVFDPAPETVQREIEEYGFEDYPGQILLWTPKMGVYPLATYDPVLDNSQTQGEIGVYQLSTIQNDFGIEKIFKYPGKFESTQEKDQFKQEVNASKGAKGAKSTMVVENPTGEELNLIESIQMQNTDKMYEFTSKDVRNAIREALSIPAAILGQLPEAGMFNQQDIIESYNYFNTVTKVHRNQISRLFEKIFKYWNAPVNFTYDIKPQQYLQAGIVPEPGSSTPTSATPPTKAIERSEMNEALSKLDGKQNINLDRIIRQYDSGKLTYDRAIQKMTMTFPITKDEAVALLGEND